MAYGQYSGRRAVKPFVRYFLAKLKERNERRTYEIYVADLLNVIAKPNYENWKVPFYSDMIRKKEVKEQNGDEIAMALIEKAGLKLEERR